MKNRCFMENLILLRPTAEYAEQIMQCKKEYLAADSSMDGCGPMRRTALNHAPSVAFLKSLGFKLIETEKVSFYKDADGNDIVFDGGAFELSLENAD